MYRGWKRGVFVFSYISGIKYPGRHAVWDLQKRGFDVLDASIDVTNLVGEETKPSELGDPIF